MTASDVASSFNRLKNNPTLTPVNPPPIPASATATNATTAVLTFSQPEYANLYLIGGMYVVPQHVWQGVGDPSKFADPSPVGTGPYVVSQFSAQKYTLSQNAKYWQLSKVHVPSIIFPNYVSNDTANPALSNGHIDYAGNAVSNVLDSLASGEAKTDSMAQQAASASCLACSRAYSSAPVLVMASSTASKSSRPPFSIAWRTVCASVGEPLRIA